MELFLNIKRSSLLVKSIYLSVARFSDSAVSLSIKFAFAIFHRLVRSGGRQLPYVITTKTCWWHSVVGDSTPCCVSASFLSGLSVRLFAFACLMFCYLGYAIRAVPFVNAYMSLNGFFFVYLFLFHSHSPLTSWRSQKNYIKRIHIFFFYPNSKDMI